MKKLIIILAIIGFCEVSLAAEHEDENFCRGCRAIVSFASQFNSSSSREFNKELFQNFCELYYPASTDYQTGACPIFLETFFFVLDHIDPIMHCDQIEACSPATKEESKKAIIRSRQALRDDSNVFCQACSQIVSDMKTMLTDPQYKNRIKETINALCDYLKVVDQSEQCKQIADNYMDQAFDYIKNIDPKVYCESLQLCHQSKLPKAPRRNLPTLVDFNNFGIETAVSVGQKESAVSESFRASPSCALCKQVVRELFKFLRENKTESTIKQALEKVCTFLPNKDQDQCQEMVNAYSKELIDLLIQETDPELICVLMDQCRHNSQPKFSNLGELISILDPTVKARSLKSCVECKLFIKYLKDNLDGEATKEKVRDWLMKNLCQKVEDDMRSSCTAMINKYLDSFMQAISDELDPQETCEQLQACRQRHRSEILYIDNSVPIKAKLPQGTCDTCVSIISKIDEYVSKHSAEQDIQVIENAVCTQFDDPNLKRKCRLVIEMFGNQIVSLIPDMSDPREVCSSLGLC